MKNIYSVFEENKFQSEKKRENEIQTWFMSDYFNIIEHDTPSQAGIEFASSRMVVNVIDAMNKRQRLPKYLLVIPDQDILLQDIDVYDKDAPILIQELVDWFVQKIDVKIRRRRLDMLEHKPGALTGFFTKIIFIKMVRRWCTFSEESRKFAVHQLRAKFNDALNDAVAKRELNILTVSACYSPQHFDHKRNLSPAGKKEFWREVDELINRFDLDKIKLLPNPKNPPHSRNTAKHATMRNNKDRRRLPPPPESKSRNSYY